MGAANFYRGNSQVDENIVGSWTHNHIYSEIITGSGNDRVNFGWIFNGYASTGQGDDYITSFTGAGRYTINDGAGNDVVSIGGIHVEIRASEGNDKYYIWSGGNVYIGLGAGTKTVSSGYVWGEFVVVDHTRGSGSYDRVINGSSANTRVYTARGNDKIGVWGGFNCVVVSEGGHNRVKASSMFNTYVATGSGNDNIRATSATSVTVISGGGEDSIHAGAFYVYVDAGAGDDTIIVDAVGARVDAGQGNDTMIVNVFGADISAGEGDDTLYQGGFGARIDMGSGNDTVHSFSFGGQNVMLGSGNNRAFLVGGLNIVQAAHGDNYVQSVGTANIFLLGQGQNTVLAYGFGNLIFTGNGKNNIQALGGVGNIVMVGDGQNTVRVAGGSNIVWAGNGGGVGASFRGSVVAVPQIVIPRLIGTFDEVGGRVIYRRGRYSLQDNSDYKDITSTNSYYDDEGFLVKHEMWTDRELHVQSNIDKDNQVLSTGKYYTDTRKSANQDVVLPWWRRGALNRGASMGGLKKSIHDNLLENTTLVTDEEIRSERLSRGQPDYDESTYHYRNTNEIKQDVLAVLNKKYLYANRPGNTIFAHGSFNFVVSGRGDDKIRVGGYVSKLGELGDNDIWDEDLPQDHLKNIITGGIGTVGNTVFAGEGDNVVKAYGMGSNFIMTGSGHDYIVAFGGLNTIIAGDGFNKIEVIGFENYILGGRGQDALSVMGYRNYFFAGDGDNIMTGSGRRNIFIGAGGDDDVMILGLNNMVIAGDGDNFIMAIGQKNFLQGASGNDNIFTSGTENWILAGHGHNFVLAVGLRNKVWAGDGHDTIMVMGYNNVVLAGDGRNSISMGGLNNYLLSGSGRDTIFMAGASNMVSSASGADSLRVFGKLNVIHSGGGDDSVLSIGEYNATMAGWGDDVVISIGKANITITEGGDDKIVSLGKNNMLLAGSGDDMSLVIGMNNFVIGGGGSDFLVTIGKLNVVTGDNTFALSTEDMFAFAFGGMQKGAAALKKGASKLKNVIKSPDKKLLGSKTLKGAASKTLNTVTKNSKKVKDSAVNFFKTKKNRITHLTMKDLNLAKNRVTHLNPLSILRRKNKSSGLGSNSGGGSLPSLRSRNSGSISRSGSLSSRNSGSINRSGPLSSRNSGSINRSGPLSSRNSGSINRSGPLSSSTNSLDDIDISLFDPRTSRSNSLSSTSSRNSLSSSTNSLDDINISLFDPRTSRSNSLSSTSSRNSLSSSTNSLDNINIGLFEPNRPSDLGLGRGGQKRMLSSTRGEYDLGGGKGILQKRDRSPVQLKRVDKKIESTDIPSGVYPGTGGRYPGNNNAPLSNFGPKGLKGTKHPKGTNRYRKRSTELPKNVEVTKVETMVAFRNGNTDKFSVRNVTTVNTKVSATTRVKTRSSKNPWKYKKTEDKTNTNVYSETFVTKRKDNVSGSDVLQDSKAYDFSRRGKVKDKNGNDTNTYIFRKEGDPITYIGVDDLSTAPLTKKQKVKNAGKALWDGMGKADIKNSRDLAGYLSGKRKSVWDKGKDKVLPSKLGKVVNGVDKVNSVTGGGTNSLGYLQVEILPTLTIPELDFSDADTPDWKTPTVTIPQINFDLPNIPETPSTPGYVYGELGTYRIPEIDFPTISFPSLQFPGVTLPSLAAPDVTEFDVNVEEALVNFWGFFQIFSNLGMVASGMLSSYMGMANGGAQFLGSFSAVSLVHDQHGDRAALYNSQSTFSLPGVPATGNSSFLASERNIEEDGSVTQKDSTIFTVGVDERGEDEAREIIVLTTTSTDAEGKVTVVHDYIDNRAPDDQGPTIEDINADGVPVDADGNPIGTETGEARLGPKSPFKVSLPTLHLPRVEIPEFNLIGAFQLSGLDVDHLDKTNTNYGDNAYKMALAEKEKGFNSGNEGEASVAESTGPVLPEGVGEFNTSESVLEDEANYINEWGLSRLTNAFMERSFFGIQIPKLFDTPNFAIPDVSLHSILGQFFSVKDTFSADFSLELPSFEIPSITGIDWSRYIPENLFGKEYNILGGGAEVGTPENNADITISIGKFNRVMAGDGDDINVVVGKFNSVFGGKGDDINLVMGSQNVVYGSWDNDIIVGIGQNNSLYGGSADDVILAVGQTNYVTGGRGKNIIATIGMSNTVGALGGEDFIFQLGMNNSLTASGGGGFMALQIGKGNFAYVGGGSHVLVQVGQMNSAFLYDYDSTIVQVGLLNTVLADSGSTIAEGGNDIIAVFGALNFTAAQKGDDIMLGVGMSNNLLGGGGDDIVISAGLLNLLAGHGGDDVMINFGLETVITAGVGDDIVINSGLHAAINGGDGDDLLINLKDVVDWSGDNNGNDTFVEMGWTFLEALKVSGLGIINNAIGELGRAISKIEDVFTGGGFGYKSVLDPISGVELDGGIGSYYARNLVQSIDYHVGNTQKISAGKGNDILVAGFSNMVVNGGEGEDTYIYTLGSGGFDITEVMNGEVDTLWVKNNFSQDWNLHLEDFYLYQYESGEHVVEIVYEDKLRGSITLTNWSDDDIIVFNDQDDNGGRMTFLDFKKELLVLNQLDEVDESGEVQDFGYNAEIEGVAGLEISALSAIEWLNHNPESDHFEFTSEFFLTGGQDVKGLVESQTRKAVDDFANAKVLFESILAPPS